MAPPRSIGATSCSRSQWRRFRQEPEPQRRGWRAFQCLRSSVIRSAGPVPTGQGACFRATTAALLPTICRASRPARTRRSRCRNMASHVGISSGATCAPGPGADARPRIDGQGLTPPSVVDDRVSALRGDRRHIQIIERTNGPGAALLSKFAPTRTQCRAFSVGETSWIRSGKELFRIRNVTLCNIATNQIERSNHLFSCRVVLEQSTHCLQ